jgi:nucleotide-binding universal stress UspA family protein
VFPIRKILCPTDYSDLARPAFELACALARDFGAELVVCHVSPQPIPAVIVGMAIDIPSGETEQLTARLEQVKPTDSRIRVTHRLLRGAAAGEILRLADDAGADLIVMGTRGFGRLLMGSVAEEVMRKTPCPVVTVKAPQPVARPEGPAKQPATA